jgi:hypothetical protein
MKQRQLTPEQKRAQNRVQIQKRRFVIYRAITFLILGFIVIGILWSVFQKDKTYSETENRVLAAKPELSLSSLSSGQYMSDMESYITDQFFLRNQWIKLKTTEDLAVGKRESNGVYIGKNQNLLEIQDDYDKDNVIKTAKAISDFADKHETLNQTMTLVPNAGYICDQLRPKNAPVHDQSKDITLVKENLGDNITYFDLTETMKSHKKEQIYYKTDHHWTSLGAKYAFEALAPQLKITDVPSEYTVYPVTHSFQGTLSSKSGYTRAEDTIEVYIPKDGAPDTLVNYTEQGEKTASIYHSSALKQKDKYEVFFGGNYARIDIDTPTSPDRNLLIFKDSYANCMIQFLQPYFRTITMIDARYYYDDVDRVISDRNITDILYLYNVNTFMTDTSLADVLSDAGAEAEGSLADAK